VSEKDLCGEPSKEAAFHAQEKGDTSRTGNLCTFTEKRHTVFNDLAGNCQRFRFISGVQTPYNYPADYEILMRTTSP
jgi:hypothetical protein